MLSGSDLDGDQFHVCWEPEIVDYLCKIFKGESPTGQRFWKPADFTIPMKEGQPPPLPDGSLVDALRVSQSLSLTILSLSLTILVIYQLAILSNHILSYVHIGGICYVQPRERVQPK